MAETRRTLAIDLRFTENPNNNRLLSSLQARTQAQANTHAQSLAKLVSAATSVDEAGLRLNLSRVENVTKQTASTIGISFQTSFNAGIAGSTAFANAWQQRAQAIQRDTKITFRVFVSEAQTAGRGAEESLRRGLTGSVFDQLRTKATGTFAAIRAQAGSALSGLGGGGSSGGGSGLLGTVLGFAGGGILGSVVTSAFGGVFDKVKGIASQGLDFNALEESATISLTRILGNAQAARTEIERLKKDGLEAPVDFRGLLTIDQRLLNASFNAKLLRDNLVPFTQGSALIAGTDDFDEKLNGISRALAQMAQKSRLSNEELGQLADRQIPAYKLLGEAIGKSTDEVFRLAESGQLDGLKTAELLVKRIAGEAAKVGPEVKNSFAVLSSNLSDLQEQAAGRATQNLFRDAKDLLKIATGNDAQKIIGNIAGGFDSVEGKVSGLLRVAVESLKSGNLFDVGQKTVEGLAQGIAANAQGAWDKAKELGGGVLDAVKRVLEIQSPSKKMRELGEYAADGFVDGLVDRTSEGFKRWATQIEKIGGEEFIKAIERIAKRVGANPNDLLGVMAFESKLNPRATNRDTNATGLIQFLPGTARSFGTSRESLLKQTGLEQLAYVEKYLSQFGKVLDTTEKVYSAVLRGKVLNDPNTTLFREGTLAFSQNAGLDKDRSGAITLAEAAAQVRRQGFTRPGLGGLTIPGGEVITDVRGQLEPVALNLTKINAQLDHVPPAFQQSAAAASQAAQQTKELSGATATAAEQAKNFAEVWRNPLDQQIKKTREEIAQIGQHLDSKALLAQLEAIKQLKQAEEDAILHQIALRTDLANKTVFSANRANAAVLDHLNREVRGVTEIVASAKVGVIDTIFSSADRAIDKLTDKLGVFKHLVADVLSGLTRLALAPALTALAGGNQAAAGGGGGFNIGGINFGGGSGGFTTPSFSGAQIPGVGGGGGGTGSGGGLNIGGFNLGGLRSIVSRIPGLGGLFNRGAAASNSGLIPLSDVNSRVFGGLGADTALGRAAGVSQTSLAAPSLLSSLGATGALAGGGILGSLLGGKSPTGRLLGGIGGSLLGGSIAATGLFGGGLGAALPALFTNPITAVVGAALLGGAAIFRLLHGRDLRALAKTIKEVHAINVETRGEGEGLLKQIKKIGQDTYGNRWQDHRAELVQQQSVIDLLTQYAVGTGQNNSPLVRNKQLQDPFDPRNNFVRRYTGGIVPGSTRTYDYVPVLANGGEWVSAARTVQRETPTNFAALEAGVARITPIGSNQAPPELLARLDSLEVAIESLAATQQMLAQVLGTLGAVPEGHVLLAGLGQNPPGLGAALGTLLANGNLASFTDSFRNQQ